MVALNALLNAEFCHLSQPILSGIWETFPPNRPAHGSDQRQQNGDDEKIFILINCKTLLLWKANCNGPVKLHTSWKEGATWTEKSVLWQFSCTYTIINKKASPKSLVKFIFLLMHIYTYQLKSIAFMDLHVQWQEASNTAPHTPY